MRLSLLLAVIVVLAVTLTACTTVGIERAKVQERDAAARAARAPYEGEVSVINAKRDAILQELSQLSLLSKEERLFDAQLARNEFATIVLEFQALELAIRQETEAARQATAELEEVTERADGVGHNALAAANNSWATNWALAVFGVLLFGFGTMIVVFCAKFERRLAALEE